MLTTKRLVAQVGVAMAAMLLQLVPAHAFTASDRASAIVVYPKIVVDSEAGIDTVVQLANNFNNTAGFPVAGGTIQAHCFYVNANNRCTNDSHITCDTSADCGGVGLCVPGWAVVDFRVILTENQPLVWVASVGRNNACIKNGTCDPFPLTGGSGERRCDGNSGLATGTLCSSDAQCQPPGNPNGKCQGLGVSNAGTAIPPVGEDPFRGELKCVQINNDGSPATRGSLGANDLIGNATIVDVRGFCGSGSGNEGESCFQADDCEASTGVDDCQRTPDAESYNAVGLQANECNGGDRGGLPCNSDAQCPGDPSGVCENNFDGDAGILRLGGPDPEYQGCAATLILDHIFDGAPDPIKSDPDPNVVDVPERFITDLTLVPCSEDFLLGSANVGRSTASFLVFNEFEQRFSTSRQVSCFDETLLSNIDTRNNSRSIFSVNVAGTIAGQTRIRPIGSGLMGVARAMKIPADQFPPTTLSGRLPAVLGPGSAYNLHEQGQRMKADEEDIIVLH